MYDHTLLFNTHCYFSLIMTVAYTGNLTSFMTNPGFEDPLDTPAKLLEKGVQLGMYNYQGSTTLAFGGSSNPEYCQIWAAKDWITSFGDSMEGTIAGRALSRRVMIPALDPESDFQLFGDLEY